MDPDRQYTWIAGVLLLAGLVGSASFAQNKSLALSRNFKLPEYYKPDEIGLGQTNQFKSLLLAKEVRLNVGRPAEAIGVHIETYDPQGATNIVATSPQCFADLNERVAWSAEHIEVRSGDGRLLIEGEGFFCRLTNATFIISNRVRTVIQKDIIPVELRKP